METLNPDNVKYLKRWQEKYDFVGRLDVEECEELVKAICEKGNRKGKSKKEDENVDNQKETQQKRQVQSNKYVLFFGRDPQGDDECMPYGLRPDPPPYPASQPPPPPPTPPTAPPPPIHSPHNPFLRVNVTPQKGKMAPQDIRSTPQTRKGTVYNHITHANEELQKTIDYAIHAEVFEAQKKKKKRRVVNAFLCDRDDTDDIFFRGNNGERRGVRNGEGGGKDGKAFTCYNCGRVGHYARSCRAPTKKMGRRTEEEGGGRRRRSGVQAGGIEKRQHRMTISGNRSCRRTHTSRTQTYRDRDNRHPRHELRIRRRGEGDR